MLPLAGEDDLRPHGSLRLTGFSFGGDRVAGLLLQKTHALSVDCLRRNFEPLVVKYLDQPASGPNHEG